MVGYVTKIEKNTSQIYKYTQRRVQNKTHLADDIGWWNEIDLGC